MGHPEPFDLKYVAIGNEDCGKKNYQGFHHFLLMFSVSFYLFIIYRMELMAFLEI